MITIKVFRYPEMVLNGGGMLYFGIPSELPRSLEFIRHYRTWLLSCLRTVDRDGGYAIVQVPLHFLTAQLPTNADVVNFVGEENRMRISMVHFVKGNATEWQFLLAAFRLLRAGLTFGRIFTYAANNTGYLASALDSTQYWYVSPPKLLQTWNFRRKRTPVVELSNLWAGARWWLYQKLFHDEVLALVPNDRYAKWRKAWKLLSSN